MANYLITNCGGGTRIVDSGVDTLVLGSIYYLSLIIGEDIESGCYTIDSVTLDPPDGTINVIVDSYENCLECLQSDAFAFLASACNGVDEDILINPNQFTEWPIGNFYTICNDVECDCFEVYGYIEAITSSVYTISVPYSDCSCGISPRSANTEVDMCLEICTPEGNTVVSVNPPHPEWTDGYGTQVTQLNMITLGGQNGLNN
jgi:hypothetical protein